MSEHVFWDLSDPCMVDALREAVRGQPVVELGGGGGKLANLMVQDCLADYVMVVEKDTDYRKAVDKAQFTRIHYYWGYALDFAVRSVHAQRLWGAAVVSFPPNYRDFDLGAIEVFRHAARVVIIGLNDGVTAVGTSELWKYLVTRERISEVTGSRNDLVVYGANPRPPGQPLSRIEQFGLQYDSVDISLCLTTSRPSLPRIR